jgi:UDP-N-acetylglucosamine 2-epimerase (non-hydrolysing)
MTTVRQVLVATPKLAPQPSDGLEAVRVEQAVAWMFGLCPSPLLTPNLPFSANDSATNTEV